MSMIKIKLVQLPFHSDRSVTVLYQDMALAVP
jgi:hypothetical protein